MQVPAAQPPLVATKWFVPRLRADRVERARLRERLEQSRHTVLVSAPAGSGKSVLLADWALAQVLNEVAAGGNRANLILDDYHVIESQAIHRLMQFLIDHLPPNLRLVLATRSDPPLALSRLRARGELTEIRDADLRPRRQSERSAGTRDVQPLPHLA